MNQTVKMGILIHKHFDPECKYMKSNIIREDA